MVVSIRMRTLHGYREALQLLSSQDAGFPKGGQGAHDDGFVPLARSGQQSDEKR